VTRNRITDLFRKKRSAAWGDPAEGEQGGEVLPWEELLPSREAGPEAAYARSVLLEELEETLNERFAAL
jgi:hypothetical protein